MSLCDTLASPSRNQILHHLAMHIGQAEAAALVQKCQPFMIHAEQAQHRGVEIVNMDVILYM